jgi:hypothetical protein
MQALTSTWAAGQSQLGSLTGLVSNGYEALPQDPTGYSAHSTIYNFVDADEFIYDGGEWDDDLSRGSGKTSKDNGSGTNNSGSSGSNGLDRWGDYSGSWEGSEDDDDESTMSSQSSRQGSPRAGNAAPPSKQSPKSSSGSPKGRSTGGGFWGLFGGKQRQQQTRVEPLRSFSS